MIPVRQLYRQLVTKVAPAVATVTVVAVVTPTSAIYAAPPTLNAPVIHSPDQEPLAAPRVTKPRDQLGGAPVVQAVATASIPGVGPKTMSQLPANSTQVLVATTPQASDTNAHLTLFERDANGWKAVREFNGHNGRNGWRENRTEGDETTPAGVFSLSDAGGTLADPGSLLPYSHDRNLSDSAESVYGPEYSEVFDYVIAVDYNRVPGNPPTDPERPQGREKGGGIWLHVDHGDPTHGCVTVPKEDMKWLLTHLDPAKKPHVIFGDQAYVSA